MPIAINTSRPPSAASVPGAQTPRTTTTSRRGGRTRSRSPPVVGGRMQHTPEMPGPADNPSMAAAAAAAAAKALAGSDAPSNRSAWPQEGDEAYHSGYEKSRNWLPSDDPYAHMRSRYQYGEARPSPFRPHPSDQDYERRSYRPHRYDTADRRHPRGERISEPPPPGHYPPDYRYDSRDREARHKNVHTLRSTGGTTLVLGGTTPIHVPKRANASYSRHDHRASAASVFRGRPGDDEGPLGRPHDDDTPQKILLSLRTPTSSFEEKPRKASTSLSPEDPPDVRASSTDRKVDCIFELQRSPEGSKNTIDIAPSFTLFNQSFDSFGDGNYFPMDGALQNDSFGLGRVDNGEDDHLLQQNSSVGIASQQLLTNSASGPLAIGYSPVNSFGVNPTPSTSRRGGNTIVLGGPDTRASSPTQVLGMYRSYSGGGAALDDAHLRMSTSFGGQSLRYGESSSPPPFYARSSENADPPFYLLLRKFRMAFKNCAFVLPGLKSALLEVDGSDCSGDDSKNGTWDTIRQHYHSGQYADPSAQDIAIARRRVECSVCAFGGSVNRDQPPASPNKDILKSKDGLDLVAVTPSSSITSPPGTSAMSSLRLKYDESLASRYYENESRLSWAFEEEPPVEFTPDEEMPVGSEKSEGDATAEKDGDGEDYCRVTSGNDDATATADKDGDATAESKRVKAEDNNEDDEDDEKNERNLDEASKTANSANSGAKMRYRCKLCGQPKQNHRCPFQQSLARSIGIMVYPAVNAFTADEPGSLATPLSEMNNFTDILKDSQSMDDTPSRPTPERSRRHVSVLSATTQVTPESLRSGKIISPSSYATPARSGGSRHPPMGRHGKGKKRGYGHMSGIHDDHSDLLFLDSMELKQEQFRVINCRNRDASKGAYSYSALPLPYAQRKRLSDNLFSLSSEVPKLTDECAQVLREAREKDMWDLAVAELMTQVIVIIHCPDGDNRFEGLRQYLLTLGIAS